MDPIQLPDLSGIAELSKADLEALKEQIEANLKAIFEVDDADVTKDIVENAKAHQAALDQVGAQLSTITADEDEFRAMREQFEAPAEEVETEVVDEAEVTEETPVAEVEPAVEETAAAEAPVLVNAATVRKTVARSSGRPKAPAPAKVETPKAQINVAPDVPGYSASQELADMTDVAKAFISRTKGFRVGALGRHQAGVAVIRKPFEPDLVVDTGDEEEIYRAVQRAGNEKLLPGGNLTAASGWCSPSETLYDLCPGGSSEGLFDLPEIQIRRGGVRHTNGPDFAPLYADTDNGGWDFTEAEVIAGVEKPCIEVECPEWEDVRLDAVGLCVSSGLLTRSAFPELVSAFTAEALIAHQHRISAKVLGSVLTSAGAPQVSGNLGSIAGGALAAVELIAERERGVRRWPMSETLEVTAPHWFRSALRADYSMRNGVDLQAVSDQTINSYFAARNLRIQYVYGWQALNAGATAYPETVQLLVYRAGTFVKGTADVINLSAIYDSANLKNNKYIELFFEEGVLVLQRCYGAAVVQVPVCVGGITGAAVNEECMTLAGGTTTTTTTT